MARPLPQPTLDSLAGVDARLQAIDKLEELVEEVVREKARHRSNIALKRAVRTWRKGDIVKAGQWALNSWPNMLITAILIALACILAIKRGYSPVEIFSRKADVAVVNTLRRKTDKSSD